jgi:hypothetical protein
MLGTEPFAIALPVITAALLLTLRIFDPVGAKIFLPIALGAVGLVLGSVGLRVVFAFRRSACAGRVAWEIDRRLGLKDALSTAIEVLHAGTSGLFATALVQRTASAIDARQISQAFPLLRFRPGWATSALLMLLVLLLPVLVQQGQDSVPLAGMAGTLEDMHVPNLVGQTLPAARITLKQAGFGVGRETIIPALGTPGIVVGQLPAPGSIVKRGSPVDLFIRGPGGRGTVQGPEGAKNAPSQSELPSPKGGNARDDHPPIPSPAASASGKGKGDGKGGHKPPLLGDPERTPASFEDVKVKPLFGPAGKTRMAEIEVPIPEVRGKGKGPGKDGTPEMQLNELLIRYEKRAEHALSTGRIGKEDRKTVIDYFERVKALLNNGK